MHGADGRQVRRGRLPPQLLADLRRPPAGILPLQPHNHRFQLRRQSVRLTIRPAAPICERRDTAVLVPFEDLVTGLTGDPDLGAQRRHFLALEQAGHKAEPLVHDVTLLPRHAPSSEGAKVSPMCPEYGVTSLSGRTKKNPQVEYVPYIFSARFR